MTMVCLSNSFQSDNVAFDTLSDWEDKHTEIINVIRASSLEREVASHTEQDMNNIIRDRIASRVKML